MEISKGINLSLTAQDEVDAIAIQLTKWGRDINHGWLELTSGSPQANTVAWSHSFDLLLKTRSNSQGRNYEFSSKGKCSQPGHGARHESSVRGKILTELPGVMQASLLRLMSFDKTIATS